MSERPFSYVEFAPGESVRDIAPSVLKERNVSAQTIVGDAVRSAVAAIVATDGTGPDVGGWSGVA